MCYSAQLVQDHREFLREFPDATISIDEFAKLARARLLGAKVTLSKALEHSFVTSDRPEDAEVAGLLKRYADRREQQLREELAFQEARLEKAQNAVAKRETKAALDSVRIATNKISKLRLALADLDRDELLPRDSRVYPKGYAPVLILRDGELTLLPMRYLLRPAGKPIEFDVTNEGCYNARRDNLPHFWKKQFGHTHGVVMMERFYENVWLTDFERRALREGEKPSNAVIEFRPNDGQTMFVACLWSYWEQAGDELYSFAIVTDEPPPEVRETGHDRCVVQLCRDAVMDWLDTDGKSQEQLLAVLDRRPEVRYQARLTGSTSDPAPLAKE